MKASVLDVDESYNKLKKDGKNKAERNRNKQYMKSAISDYNTKMIRNRSSKTLMPIGENLIK